MLVRRSPLEKLLLSPLFTGAVRAGVVPLAILLALRSRSSVAGLSRLSIRAIDDRKSDAKLCSDADVAGVESRLNEFFQWEPPPYPVLFNSIVDPMESLLLIGSFASPPYSELAVESLL